MNTEFRLKEFEKFHFLLMQNAPEGYVPYYFACAKNNKNPEISRGSWKDNKNRLSFDEVKKQIKNGYNIGLAGTDSDRLCIVDYDNESKIHEAKSSLSDISRKGCGGHFFYFLEKDVKKTNCATDKNGEMRSHWQYVLIPGSYVPTTKKTLEKELNEGHITQKRFDELSKSDKLGYYYVRTETPANSLNESEYPTFIKDELLKSDEKIKRVLNHTKKDLHISDVLGYEFNSLRNSHPIHDSETGSNFSVNSDNTCWTCWRHNVTGNALQLLSVKEGFLTCKEAGVGHNGTDGGASLLKGNVYKKTIEKAKQLGFKVSSPSSPSSPNNNKENDLLIQSLLENDVPQVDQFKSGIHNGSMYYGITLYSSRDKKIYSAVVTDTKDVFVDWGKERNDIINIFGLFYKYDFEFEALDNSFTRKGVQKFRNGDKVSLKKLYERLLKINKNFMYYVDDEQHESVCLDIISTYFLPCFEAIGRTFLEAEKGSGKTRQCTIYKLLGFNSIMTNDMTKASFFRIMESTCGTLIIDDFDSINEEQRNDVLQHYKTGYKNSSKSIRAGDSKSRKLDSFRNYGHVVMNNTEGLDEISQDRSKMFELVKTDKKITKANINEKNQIWRELSDDLYICGLQYWKEIKETYDDLSTDISGRDFEVIRPILAVAKCISDDLFSRMEKYWIGKLKSQKYVDLETDWNYLIHRYIWDNKRNSDFYVNDIANHILQKCFDSEFKRNEKRRGIQTFVGKKLAKSSLWESRLSGGYSIYSVKSSKHFEDYMLTKGWIQKTELGELGEPGGLGGLKQGASPIEKFLKEKGIYPKKDVADNFGIEPYLEALKSDKIIEVGKYVQLSK